MKRSALSMVLIFLVLASALVVCSYSAMLGEDVSKTSGVVWISSRQNDTASAVIEGIVKDSDTGDPVIGAKIILRSSALPDVTTGENGTYRFEGLREGVHLLDVSAEGYKTKTVRVVLTKNSTMIFDIELAQDVDKEEYNVFFWVGVGVFVSLIGLLITIYYVSGKKAKMD